jgi:hypothetical protein
MATRSNKITIHVKPARHQQSMSIRASGRFGHQSLIIPPIYVSGQALSPTTSPEAYWNAVLVLAQAVVLSH